MYIYYVYIQCKRVVCKKRSPSLGDPLGGFGWSLGPPCMRGGKWKVITPMQVLWIFDTGQTQL